MNKFYWYLLSKISKKIVIQGGHKGDITRAYKIIAEAARDEFTEDTKPQLDSFLSECHKDSIAL